MPAEGTKTLGLGSFSVLLMPIKQKPLFRMEIYMTQSFLKWAKQNGWQAEASKEPLGLPTKAFQRYANLPADYIEFLRNILLLSNKDDTSWFLTIHDFEARPLDTPWQPDAFEKISLEAAGSDTEEQNTIIQFWDEHIPVVFCLASGYEYYAIHVLDGAVVNGIEPEFEEVSIVAVSFKEFLAKIMQGEIIL